MADVGEVAKASHLVARLERRKNVNGRAPRHYATRDKTMIAIVGRDVPSTEWSTTVQVMVGMSRVYRDGSDGFDGLMVCWHTWRERTAGDVGSRGW